MGVVSTVMKFETVGPQRSGKARKAKDPRRDRRVPGPGSKGFWKGNQKGQQSEVGQVHKVLSQETKDRRVRNGRDEGDGQTITRRDVEGNRWIVYR